MSSGVSLRREAEAQAGALPGLLLAAEQLAATVQMGGHGRRRAGAGEEFWQYRPALAGDSLRFVDWRRSARSDVQYVRDREWQLAQSLSLWADGSASMRFSGAKGRVTKADRARLLALALAVLAVRAGERVGLGPLAPPRPGRAQLMTLAALLSAEGTGDYGLPEVAGVPGRARAAFLSDFFGDIDAIKSAVGQLSDRGVSGVLLQVVDPAEEEFPFDGRTIFESMSGSLRHETREARDLRDRYRARLAARRDRLEALARTAGWQVSVHRTDAPAAAALLWLYAALERGRG
ncbi:DUF58 domain-containing protein [Paenirhodobacter sp.]|uniref:DUF58 domain-containing protein n=1 Tax=Paenirhodobacter sp. TaxID=1965326 RepID=UPI003B3BFCF9